ncbi:ubiquinol oxidase subunit II [Alicyclobacillus ferrooxydans]|nr:ubiquinol oxidase subunit II [Alicyclobacillus ferrooxydans]
MKRITPKGKLVATLAMGVSTLLLTSGCGQLLVFHPAGPVGQSELQLIWLQIALTAVVIIPVLILLAIIVIRYRDRPGSKAVYRPDWSENRTLEIIWWVIPIIIVGILGTVTAKKTFALTQPPKNPSNPTVVQPLTIEVTSMDWKWLFQYPNQQIATVNYCVIPTNRPVQFMLTSNGPMNAFWVPQLGGMEYTMPGMIMRLWLQADKPGIYYGHGGNFTGQGFAQMQFNVQAESEQQFNAWVASIANNSPQLTQGEYDKMAQPSILGQMSFSSFPPNAFENVVMSEGGKYMKHDQVMMNSISSK